MSEILFRGKRLDNGEWVDGNFYESGISGAYILQKVTRKTVDAKTGEITMRDEPVPFEIDPFTVGQYTGLKDKNGKRIFEGDIVRFAWEHFVLSSPGGYFVYPSGTVFKVGCLESGYMLCRTDDNSSAPNANGKVTNYNFWNFQRGFEIIGNIHDNPEFLEK